MPRQRSVIDRLVQLALRQVDRLCQAVSRSGPRLRSLLGASYDRVQSNADTCLASFSLPVENFVHGLLQTLTGEEIVLLEEALEEEMEMIVLEFLITFVLKDEVLLQQGIESLGLIFLGVHRVLQENGLSSQDALSLLHFYLQEEGVFFDELPNLEVEASSTPLQDEEGVFFKIILFLCDSCSSSISSEF